MIYPKGLSEGRKPSRGLQRGDLFEEEVTTRLSVTSGVKTLFETYRTRESLCTTKQQKRTLNSNTNTGRGMADHFRMQHTELRSPQ